MKRKHSTDLEALSNSDDDEFDDDVSYDGDADPDNDGDEAISDDEVDGLLDAYLESEEKPAHIEKTKQVMKQRSQDYFEILPEDWIQVTHNSGMPLYLHRTTRICTLSKPYYLGTDSVRKHRIPVSAIPCLQYRRDLEKESKDQEHIKSNHTNNIIIKEENGKENNKCPIENFSDQACEKQIVEIIKSQDLESSDLTPLIDIGEVTLTEPTELTESTPSACSSSNPITNDKESSNATDKQPKVETIQDHKRVNCLSPSEVKDYCSRLFEFETITVKKFKTWADRRRYNTMVRAKRQRPSLPSDTRFITCQATGARKEFVMNPAGKSFVCILHEYVQHQEKVQPRYVYKELENANTPYSATVLIKETTYGVGYGNSKRQAKSEAAKKTIEILIPEIKDFTEASTSLSGQVNSSKDLRFFDNIKIEDSRVTELCTKAGQQSPYQILVECLKRNAGTCDGDLPITHHVQIIKPQKNVYTMTVNEHEVKVTCKNKREGKQKAAQAILQKLHPHVTSWGGLLLMYGRGSCKTPKEKKELEQQITELQTAAVPNKPNHAILNKLREEMLKLT